MQGRSFRNCTEVTFPLNKNAEQSKKSSSANYTYFFICRRSLYDAVSQITAAPTLILKWDNTIEFKNQNI